MNLINVTIKLDEGQSLYDYFQIQVNRFMMTYAHQLSPIGRNSQDFPDESSFEHLVIPCYTGYNVFYNLENIEDETKKQQAYETADKCLEDFIHIMTEREDIKLSNNLSINLISEKSNSRELVNLSFSDDLIHLYYFNSGQW